MAGAILYPTTETLSIPAMRLLPFLTVRVFAGVALLIETNSSTGSVDPDYKTVRVPFLHKHSLSVENATVLFCQTNANEAIGAWEMKQQPHDAEGLRHQQQPMWCTGVLSSGH